MLYLRDQTKFGYKYFLLLYNNESCGIGVTFEPETKRVLIEFRALFQKILSYTKIKL